MLPVGMVLTCISTMLQRSEFVGRKIAGLLCLPPVVGSFDSSAAYAAPPLRMTVLFSFKITVRFSSKLPEQSVKPSEQAQLFVAEIGHFKAEVIS